LTIINFDNIDSKYIKRWIDDNCIHDKNYISSTVDIYNYFVKLTNIEISQTAFLTLLKKVFQTKRKIIKGKKYTVAIGLKLKKVEDLKEEDET